VRPVVVIPRSRALHLLLLACFIAASPTPLLAQSLAPDLHIRATRIGSGVAGAATTVITAQDIERSPAASIQDLLALEPGVQTQGLFGGVSGANATVDVRGFGASAASNTLVLINGRRTNEIDLQSVDYASIPMNSIERIEITRGASGAVLYGEGAVGGVINIITRQATGAPRVRGEIGAGSYGQAQASISAQAATGANAFGVFVSGVRSDGYRANNALTQGSAVLTYNRSVEWGSLFATVNTDTQSLGLPGGRIVDPSRNLNELRANRRGATTPFDYADKHGVSAHAGAAVNMADGIELIVDGGLRHKAQNAAFFGSFANPASREPRSSIEASLVTASLTPRLKVESTVFGAPWKSNTGIDYYNTQYESPRALFQGADPIHLYRLGQSSIGAYSMHTVAPGRDLSISAGGRIQRTAVAARDTLDPNAPGGSVCYGAYGCFSDTQGAPLDKASVNTAWHVGADYRIASGVSVFARAAQSFRAPNVDERIGMTPDITSTPTTFNLKTQTSRDVEAGLRARFGVINLQTSAYHMDLENEIHYSPATFSNVNLDPTKRYGAEAQASAQITETLRVKASLAYTRAVFREGPFAGKDVPLVSRETANIGVSWNILDRRLVFDGVVRYVGSRFMDNDQRNERPKTPGFGVVDIRIGGEIDRFTWSAAIHNALDRRYFDYAVASVFTPGRYSAYPLAGRTFLLRVGATF
jgi:iron complex outermembrane receptor protein